MNRLRPEHYASYKKKPLSQMPTSNSFTPILNPYHDPRERVITIAYLALVKMQEVAGGDDAADARWFAIDDVPQLAFY